MPAPEHLLPILDQLGDGGTVALAETVHQMLTNAAAGAGTPPAAEAFEAGKTYIIRAKDYGATDEMADALSELHDRTGADFVVFDVDVEISTAQLSAADAGVLGEAMDAAAKFSAALQAHDIDAEPLDDEKPWQTAVRVLREQSAEIRRLRDTSPAPQDTPKSTHDLIEASSLGDPDAVAARASVPLEHGQELAARAAALTPADLDDGPAAQAADADVIDWDDDPDQIGDAARAHAAAGPDSGQQALPGPLRAEWDEVAAMLTAGHLTDAEADELRADITARAKATEAAANPTNAEVRAWCEANKVPVNARGAVRADARAAYDAAHQEA